MTEFARLVRLFPQCESNREKAIDQNVLLGAGALKGGK